MSENILVELDGEILRVTLNRPDSGNAMTNAMAVELAGILQSASEKSRLVILKGAGEDFCIGRDGGARQGGGGAEPPKEALERRREYDSVF